MSTTSIIVNGVTYVPEPPKTGDVKIVVLHRGWVVVGRLQPHGDEPERVFTNASVIRAWGTTKGLGQLATGPTEQTKLDPCGTVRYHELSAVLSIDCEADSWSPYL